MIIKSYEQALRYTRRQAVNLLEGRNLDTNGCPRSHGVVCYGCEYSGPDGCDTCPIHEVGVRLRDNHGQGSCYVDKRDPVELYKVIQVIDTMLEERANG